MAVGVLAWALFGCGGLGSARENMNVYADATLRVSLESDPNVSSDQSTRHNHPFELTLPEVMLLLKGLEAEREENFLKALVKGNERLPVFSPEETTVLAPQVQKALAQVLPPERVTFRISYPQTSAGKEEVTSGFIWVRGNRIHMTLDRYHTPTEPSSSAIPGPYDSSFSRKPTGDHPSLPDFTLHFSPDDAVIEQTPSATAQMFASPETQVAIDRQRLAKIATDLSSDVYALSSSQVKPAMDLSPEQLADMEMKIRNLTERVKTQEAQISDLLGIVKQLTNSQSRSKTPSSSHTTK